MMLYIRMKMDPTPFRSWKSWLVNLPASKHHELTPSQQDTIASIRRMVTLAARYHVINANCLPRSLALKWLLEKQGIESELNMGLNMDNREFHGHAWLTHGGIVLNDSADVGARYPVEQEIGQRPVTE